MEAKGTFARISMEAKGTFARISIKIAKETIVPAFNHGSIESVFKRILKVQAYFTVFIYINGVGELEIILSTSRPLFR